MRVSSDRRSDYYDPFHMGSHVWLDGKRMERVIEADEENGWVIRHSMQLNERGDGYLHEILRGRVSIVNPRLLPIPSRYFTLEDVCRIFGLPLEYAYQFRIARWPWWYLLETVRLEREFLWGHRAGKSVLRDLIDGVDSGPPMVREASFSVILDEDSHKQLMKIWLDEEIPKQLAKPKPPNHNDRAWQTKRRKGR